MVVGLSSALLAAAAAPAARAASAPVDASLQRLVEDDWALQERRLGRAADSPAAVTQAVARAGQQISRLQGRLESGQLAAGQATWQELSEAARGLESLKADERLALYRRARWLTRELILRDPVLAGKPLVFMKRHRFISQMLHEYLGYFYDYGDVAGGGLCVLDRPGLSLATRDLVQGRLPRGNFTTLALAYDGQTVYFAFAPRAPSKPNFYSPDRRSFQLFAVGANGSNLRQLTDGLDDNFDPCPLPDGGLAFMSSRRGGFGRCHNPWEPLPAYTLHRMNADGTEPETLSWHETNEWHPFVLNDGRLVYIRWDYVDRSAANFHGLWTSHPDGTGVAGLFGNYTMRINACYQPHAIPGSDRILFVAGAHHAVVGGSLILLDPQRASLDPKSGEDRFESVTALTPEVCFPEAAGWPKSYFHSPWPLSEESFLVSFSFDPLPGMNSGEKHDTHTGLYYFDRAGNLELLYRDPEVACMYPIPLAPRGRPPIIATARDSDLGEEGELVLADVQRSFFPMPAKRAVRALRVFQVLPKTSTHVANDPRIGHANAESARLLLGTVPVESDGSAYFRVPARKPLYFQAVDEDGRAVQSMRSVAYLQPGERRGCIGCHENPATAVGNRPTLASRRPPSRLQSGPEGSQPFSYPLLVQPVLDRHCVRCHDGQAGPGRGKTDLTGEPEKSFSRSYLSLKPYLRWYEWGDASISQIATHPGHLGADESPLTRILEDATHRPQVQWTDAERRRLYLWLDANVPFYGTYSREEQLAQHRGQAVPPPRVQ
jgi:hypothetical protein